MNRKEIDNILLCDVILGCTEIGLLIHQSDVSVPVFDTTVIHAKKAVQIALTDS